MNSVTFLKSEISRLEKEFNEYPGIDNIIQSYTEKRAYLESIAAKAAPTAPESGKVELDAISKIFY